jgi:hypothetical protein
MLRRVLFVLGSLHFYVAVLHVMLAGYTNRAGEPEWYVVFWLCTAAVWLVFAVLNGDLDYRIALRKEAEARQSEAEAVELRR